MVEPVSLTLGAIAAAIVAKVSEKAVDRVTDEAVDAGAEAGNRVVRWLRSKLSSSKELDLVTEAPDSASAVKKLSDVIDVEVIDEKDVVALKKLVGQVEHDQPAVYQSAMGRYIVQASNSTVNVNWPNETPGR